MRKIFINFSNHPSNLWDEEQKAAAQQYGEIVDYAFPEISSVSTEKEIEQKADEISVDIISKNPAAVMCQGEYTLCYLVIAKLIASGIKTLASCTERVVSIEGNKKISIFRFVKFREYG